MSVMIGVELIETTCSECGIVYGLPQNYQRKRSENGGSWTCPNGHGQHYAKTEVQKLRESLERAQREAIKAREAAEFNDKERAAAERKVARLLKRAKGGACPVDGCKRTFTNLRRHVHDKHPELIAAIRLADAKSKP